MFNNYKEHIKELIERKQSAYIRFFNDTYNVLVKYAYVIVRNIDDAQDIISELIMDLPKDLNCLLEKNPLYIDKCQFERWLIVNVKHRCSKYFKKKIKERENEILFDDTCCYEELNTNKNKQLQSYELKDDIFLLFKDDNRRQIFILRYVLELKIKDIVKIMNVSTSTIKRELRIIDNIMDEYYKG